MWQRIDLYEVEGPGSITGAIVDWHRRIRAGDRLMILGDDRVWGTSDAYIPKTRPKNWKITREVTSVW